MSKRRTLFLDYVKADLQESTKDFDDDFVRSIQASVQQVKQSREMEERFMILHEMLRRERAEGKAEGKAEAIIELLEDLGSISEELQAKIMSETDLTVLTRWHKLAAKVESVEQFLQNM